MSSGARAGRGSVDAEPMGSSQRHRAEDLELEQRYGDLLNPIRDLTKNWEVDISAHLDQYLEELSQTPVSYHNGESTVNFTRAAFLIQGSAAVYSKKVEYLYSLVQKLASEMTHGGMNAEESQGASKAAGGASQRRKADYGFSLQEDMDEAENLDDAVGGRTGKSSRKTQLTRLRQLPLHLVLFEEDKQVRLLDTKYEMAGYNSDYILYDLPNCSCDNELCRCSQANTEACRGLDDVASAADNLDNSSPDVCDDSLSGDPPPLMDTSGVFPLSDDVGAFEECAAKPELEPVPMPPPRNPSLGRRVKEEQRVKKEDIIFVHRLCDPMEDTSAFNKPIKVMRRARKRPLKEAVETVPIYIQWALEGTCPEAFEKEMELQRKGEIMPGGEHLYKKALQAMKRIDAAEKKGFEETASDEDDCGGFGSGDDCPVDDPCCPVDDPCDSEEIKEVDWPDLDMGADGLGESEPAAAGSEESSDKDSYGNLVHSYLRECQEPMSSFQLTDLQKRVTEWENRIRPLLNEEDEREPFDIRTYCGRLLDRFGDGPAKQSMTFRSMVQGGPIWEVPRYFASSLQLANDSNVALSTDGVLEAGMDTLQLTLLSRRQHFEELEDFDASQGSVPPTLSGEGRKRKSKHATTGARIEDPGDVLRENPVVPESCREDSREAWIPGERPPPSNRARARMRAKAAALATLADDSDDNDENVAVA